MKWYPSSNVVTCWACVCVLVCAFCVNVNICGFPEESQLEFYWWCSLWNSFRLCGSNFCSRLVKAISLEFLCEVSFRSYTQNSFCFDNFGCVSEHLGYFCAIQNLLRPWSQREYCCFRSTNADEENSRIFAFCVECFVCNALKGAGACKMQSKPLLFISTWNWIVDSKRFFFVLSVNVKKEMRRLQMRELHSTSFFFVNLHICGNYLVKVFRFIFSSKLNLIRETNTVERSNPFCNLHKFTWKSFHWP